jgi:hypothetical protein
MVKRLPAPHRRGEVHRDPDRLGPLEGAYRIDSFSKGEGARLPTLFTEVAEKGGEGEASQCSEGVDVQTGEAFDHLIRYREYSDGLTREEGEECFLRNDDRRTRASGVCSDPTPEEPRGPSGSYRSDHRRREDLQKGVQDDIGLSVWGSRRPASSSRSGSTAATRVPDPTRASTYPSDRSCSNAVTIVPRESR